MTSKETNPKFQVLEKSHYRSSEKGPSKIDRVIDINIAKTMRHVAVKLARYIIVEDNYEFYLS